jgi:hypothetical protein
MQYAISDKQESHDPKSILPDAPWNLFIPQHTQNESLPAYKNFEKTTTNTTNSHIAFFDACLMF